MNWATTRVAPTGGALTNLILCVGGGRHELAITNTRVKTANALQ